MLCYHGNVALPSPDSVFERELFQNHVYPRLRELCVSQGADLLVLDPLAGLGDEFAYGHSLRDFNKALITRTLETDRNMILTVRPLGYLVTFIWIS